MSNTLICRKKILHSAFRVIWKQCIQLIYAVRRLTSIVCEVLVCVCDSDGELLQTMASVQCSEQLATAAFGDSISVELEKSS